jgi:type VI secretion system secreted protein VgrG
MAVTQDLSRAQLAFQVEGGDVDQFLVLRFRGTEGLCQLYRFEIELSSADEAVAFDDIVGKSAVLSINTEWGHRWFHGIISRFEMTGETAGQTYFRAELMPALWLLAHRYNSRIFQQKSTKDIISTVLTSAGIASDRVDMSQLNRSYEPREYCVQYRETDYNFICRLMEEEGIRWYFAQAQDGHTLVLADSGGYAPMEGDAALPYHPPTAMVVTAEHVYRFRMGQCVRPGAVVLNDFNFKTPAMNLESKSDCGRDPGLEFSDYPGEYIEQSAGQAIAQLRAEEFESRRVLGVGQSNCPRLTTGRTFELIEHPASALNASYLITAVTHEGKEPTHRASGQYGERGSVVDARVYQSLLQAQRSEDRTTRELAEALLQIASRIRAGDGTAHRALTEWMYHAGQVSKDLPTTAAASGRNPLEALALPNLLDDVAHSSLIDYDAPVYDCRFECIPASVTYRPPRVTPWPVMRGAQTARVVGPSGEEIHTDEYGRVKVQFNWDREGKFDENASCWIRVSQGSAGGQYGIMFLPRVGQEVIVDFLEGDPDQPIITGRVYNADHMPPYPLPGEKTKSVIKSRSSKGGGGSNEIRFEDLKDKEQILVYAQKDLHIRAKNDRVENIEHDRSLTVGNDRFEEIKKNYHVKVVEGNKNEEIGKDLSLHVKGKASVKVDGTCSTSVGSDVVEKFGANHKHEVSMTYAAKALSIKLEASTGIELKCGGSSIVLTPAAIFIVGGPLVNINSGSGPPVAPVTAQATTPEAPEKPKDADTVEHGRDTRYAGGEELVPAQAPPEVPGIRIEPTEAEEQQTSWISIELVDEADMPVPGERYEITAPDGTTIKRGSLDATGRAHVGLSDSGMCQICFPRLDSAAWERI